jgi:hypothetical protein
VNACTLISSGSAEHVLLGPWVPLAHHPADGDYGTGVLPPSERRMPRFVLSRVTLVTCIALMQLPKFNLLETAHLQLASRIRTVYERNVDRIAPELAALEAQGHLSPHDEGRRERLLEAWATAKRLESETIEETAAWVKSRFTGAERRREHLYSPL